MEKTNRIINIDEKTAMKALEDMRPTFDQIPDTSLDTPRVDVLHVVATALRTLPLINEDRPRFEQTFAKFPVDHLDRFETYTFALWAAEHEYRRRQVELATQQNPAGGPGRALPRAA